VSTQTTPQETQIKDLSNIAIDCSTIFSEHSEWYLALFQAIGKFTDQGEYAANALSVGDRLTVSGLARIGAYLADGSYGTAWRYSEQVKEMTHD
jgi:hypothetical protein